MRIGFIGAGKVGCTLGLYLKDSCEIVGYASRTLDSAKEAASITGSHYFETPLKVCEQSDLIYFTMPDGAIGETWEKLIAHPGARNALKGKIVAHASGSLSSDVFSGAKELGALPCSTHPLYAISSKTASAKELNRALFAIEGTPECLRVVRGLLEAKGNKVQEIPTSEKTRYHAAAVLASNHVVALFNIAGSQLTQCGFSHEDANKALAPLFLGNALHIAQDGPLESLTGPAERGDFETIAKHLSVLEGRARRAYEILNEEALEIAQEKHSL